MFMGFLINIEGWVVGFLGQMDRMRYFRPLGYEVNKWTTELDQFTKGNVHRAS